MRQVLVCRGGTADGRSVRLSGARCDLWWEFALVDSFRWEALIQGLADAPFQSRLCQVTEALDMAGLLHLPVEALTPAQRARASLGAALLVRPSLLIWEEPFAQIEPRERPALIRAIRQLMGPGGGPVLFGLVDQGERGA